MRRKLTHIKLETPPELFPFTSPRSGGNPSAILERDRFVHGNKILNDISQALETIRHERSKSNGKRNGGYLEFVSAPGYEIPIQSLEEMRSKKIRLLNVREKKILNEADNSHDDVMFATVYVDKDKEEYFLNKVQNYLNVEKDRKLNIPNTRALVNNISEIRSASLVEAFWQDSMGLIPTEELQWCEVWLRIDSESEENITQTINSFEELLREIDIESENRTLKFLERAIKLVYVNRNQLEELTRQSDDIAELRLATEAAAFWTEMENAEQAEWVESLLERLHTADSEVAVCILDTGVNNGHPLLAPILSENDCQAVDIGWLTNDHDGHGTLMAGIAGYGSLENHLASSNPVILKHRLESIKILPPDGENDIHLWGDITQQAVYKARILAPDRKRIVCMAVTSDKTRNRGRPSSWSSAIDQLITSNSTKQLFIVSAGNVHPGQLREAATNYPFYQETDGIHDPAQSWNALTIGAYTDLDQITDPMYANVYNAVASKGGLSPFTTTSLAWEKHWPIKPEIVMEGGNLGKDHTGFPTECPDLSRLSTYFDIANRHFESFSMTSLASAQAAWFAAQIQSEYPNFWPETIRALMVHSAEWTDKLKEQFLAGTTKTHYRQLLRMCGYGVPNLEKALYSASNSLTLISERTIQPFDNKKTKEMHLYDLPWPTEILQSLAPQTTIEMRITLSYFIEPEPGELGEKGRYRYASHFLRFDLKSPSENKDDFLRRINSAMREEEEGHPNTESASSHWLLGSKLRDKGSIHSDIWRGTAAELAASNIIGVIPGIGWWRESTHLRKTQSLTRYSLIVSISTAEETIDIYTPVLAKIQMTIPVEIHV